MIYKYYYEAIKKGGVTCISMQNIQVYKTVKLTRFIPLSLVHGHQIQRVVVHYATLEIYLTDLKSSHELKIALDLCYYPYYPPLLKHVHINVDQICFSTILA